MVAIAVRKDMHRHTFAVHQDLLALHSTYFDQVFRDDEVLTEIEALPCVFADFVSWMYSGWLNENKGIEARGSIPELWKLGHNLKAPDFQNFCMDFFRDSCGCLDNDGNTSWCISLRDIELIYTKTPKKSPLRKFAADCLSYKDPRTHLNSDSEDWKAWQELLTEPSKPKASWVEELRWDRGRAAKKFWDDIPPVSVAALSILEVPTLPTASYEVTFNR